MVCISLLPFPSCWKNKKNPPLCGAIRTVILEEIVRVTDLATFKADSLTEEQVSEYKEAFSLFVSCANDDSFPPNYATSTGLTFVFFFFLLL